MYWQDEGYLLSKHNFDENSIIIEAFTLDHGKYSGIVYGGNSKKQKRNFQVGNKILLDWKSKNQNRTGYFTVELINPISPFFFDDKKKSVCILSATSILKILLPERQINKNVYISFENMLANLTADNWIKSYINWELSLIKELGFEIGFLNNDNIIKNANQKFELNNKHYKIPQLFLINENQNITKFMIKEALKFNKSLLMENFIIPNQLRLPTTRSILENYYI